MPEYPATTLSWNKGKYYVVVTIPSELRQHFNGRKQLKRSTGTSDLGDTKRRQHGISTELYAQLDACKPDLRDVISDLLGWIGDAKEIQRLEDNGDLEGTIMTHPALTWVKTGKTGQMFPEFKRDRDGKTQGPASKKLMLLVRNVTDHDRKVIHSFRGNFKDMLRDAGVPKEVNDFITGHGSGDVAGKYGEGPSLRVRKEAVERLSFPYL